MLTRIITPKEMSPVARAIHAMMADEYLVGNWIFGADEHGCYITDTAFVAYVSEAESAAIQIAAGILPSRGRWNMWTGADGGDDPPYPQPWRLLQTYTHDDPEAQDLALTWRPHLMTPVALYATPTGMVPLDARYAPLLQGAPLRVHGPYATASLWAANKHGEAIAAVMRLRTDIMATEWDDLLSQIAGQSLA